MPRAMCYGCADCLRLAVCNLVSDRYRHDSVGNGRDIVVFPVPEPFNFFLDHSRSRGITEVGWELEQHYIDAALVIDQESR